MCDHELNANCICKIIPIYKKKIGKWFKDLSRICRYCTTDFPDAIKIYILNLL